MSEVGPGGDGGAAKDLSPPAFTVVVPAFNAAATLAPSIDSILAQTLPDFEVVVVDDGSADATREVAESVGDARVRVISQTNRGLPAARNLGIRDARAEVVCFLDSDDLFLPGYLEAVQGVFRADPGVDFVYTDAWTFDDGTRRVRKHTTAHYEHPPRPGPSTAAGLLHELLLRNFIIIPVAVRRQVIMATGMFDESMTAVEDYDMWVRLTLAGHRGAEAAGPLALRREHPAQMSTNFERMARNPVYMFEKLMARDDVPVTERELVRQRLAFFRREHDIYSGVDRRGALLRHSRFRLGRLRRRLGLGARWYRTPPPAVHAAFGDLLRL